MSLERPMSGYGEINEEPAIQAGLQIKDVLRDRALDRLESYIPSRNVDEAEMASVLNAARSEEAENYKDVIGAAARQHVLQLL